MNVTELFESTPLLQALGRTLVHFVWQGALLAGLIWTALNAMRRANANARYIVCCGGMPAMLLTPLVTWVVIVQSSTGIDEDMAMLIQMFDFDAMPLRPFLAPALPPPFISTSTDSWNPLSRSDTRPPDAACCAKE